MNRDRLEELLYERADGVLDDRGQAELQGLLEGSAEARRLGKEISCFIDGLDAVADVAPPAELGVRIREALNDARPPMAGPTRTTRRQQHEWARSAATLAAGLLIGAAVVHLLYLGRGYAVDRRSAAGAMQATAVPSVALPLTVELDDGAGTVKVDRDGVSVIVSAQVITESAVEVMVESDRGSLELVASTHSSPAQCEVNVGESRVTFIAGGAGTHRLEIVPEFPAQPTRLRVIVGGRVQADQWIEAGNGGAIR